MLGKTMLGAPAALLILGLGCHTPNVPLEANEVKVLVTNATCASGACTSLRVLAFPVNPAPTPGGPWQLDLGTVSTASACLTIPASAEFKITNGGTGEMTTITWTTAKAASIGAVSTGQSHLMASPTTGTFVPAEAAGWKVTLPGSATPTPAPPC